MKHDSASSKIRYDLLSPSLSLVQQRYRDTLPEEWVPGSNDAATMVDYAEIADTRPGLHDGNPGLVVTDVTAYPYKIPFATHVDYTDSLGIDHVHCKALPTLSVRAACS